MANTKFSDLTAASALGGTEVIPVIQGGNPRRTTPNAVGAYLVEDVIANGVTGKAPSQNAVYDALATKLSSQSYSVFVYNSSAGQTGNRYNSWSNLMTAITLQEGFKTIIFEQDETIPTGSYNLDYTSLAGNNGLEYNAGGWTATFGDNTTISSWIGVRFSGIRLLSTSTTGNICTFSLPTVISNNDVSHVHSTTIPFFKFTGSGQIIVSLNNSARWQKLGGGVENLDVTSSAFAAQLVIARGKGSTVNNDTLKSTNAVIFIDVLQDAAQDPTTYTLTNTGLTVGFLVAVNAVYSTNQNHVPSAKSATFTASRIAELYLCDATTAAFTANLPAATGSGLLFTFIKTDAGANAVTVDGNGSETINGATTKVLAAQYDKVTVIDGATGKWYIV